jgi:hypothetical protein
MRDGSALGIASPAKKLMVIRADPPRMSIQRKSAGFPGKSISSVLEYWTLFLFQSEVGSCALESGWAV